MNRPFLANGQRSAAEPRCALAFLACILYYGVKTDNRGNILHHYRLSLVLAVCLGTLMTFPSLPAQAAKIRPSATHLGRVEYTPRVAQRGLASPPGNFPFQTAHSSDGLVTVHYYQQPTSYATQILQDVAQVLQHPIHDNLGFALIHPVDIYAYNTRADFLLGATVQNPEETGAYSVFTPPQVFLTVDDPTSSETIGTLAHELTHIVFHENEAVSTLQNYIAFYPLWLDEGLATYDESVDPLSVSTYALTVTDAVHSNTLISLVDTFNMHYPPDPNVDYLGYAEARSFITYLHDQYGPTVFHQFIASLRDGEIWLAATQIFHATPRVLQQRWEASLGATPANAVGYTPSLAVATPFATGTIPTLAGSTQPFALSRGGDIAHNLLGIAVGLTLLMLVSITFGIWVQRRNRRPSAVVVPAAFYAAFDGYGSQMIATPASTEPESSSVATKVIAPRTLSSRRKVRTLLQWSSMILYIATPLLIWGSGMLAMQLNPRHEWAAAEFVAGLVGVGCAVLVLMFFILVPRSTRLVPGVILVMGFLVVFTPLFTNVASLGAQQASQYAAKGAYALAVQTYRDAGDTSGDDLANVQTQWAQAALKANDYATAVTHFRAALQAKPDNSYDDTVALLDAVQRWGNALANAQDYADAVQVFQEQHAFTGCDDTCQPAMTLALSTTYRAWGDELLASGKFTDAQSEYQILQRSYPTTAAGKIAGVALQECAAQPLLAQALLAGQHGDAKTMNTDLHALVHTYPHSAAASEAAETPQSISGTIQDSSGRNPAGERIFFMGYANQSAAISFNDTETVTVATTIAANGSFSVRVPPGYWYLPFWEDPTFALGQVNMSLAGDLGTFYAPAYTPVQLGTIVGF